MEDDSIAVYLLGVEAFISRRLLEGRVGGYPTLGNQCWRRVKVEKH